MLNEQKYLDHFYTQITGPSDAPKLVFLHGVMGFALNFRRIAKAFENEYQVLLYDQRGHGRSFQPESGYAPTDYADDLRKILTDLGWEKIRLVGHSMGGRAAYSFASHFPEMVTQLVIEDIGPSLSVDTGSLVIRMLDAIPVPFASKAAAKEWFDTKFLEIFGDEHDPKGLAAYLYSNMKENENKEAVWRFSAHGIRESIAHGRNAVSWDEIRNLKMPTLLMHGELSNDLSHETYERILRENARIEGVEFPQTGHWIHSEKPDLFIQALREFFDKKEGSR